MSALLHRRTDCRLCASRALVPVLRLRPTPPANAFVPPSALGIAQADFPLEVHFCSVCTHLQLPDVLDPRALFEDYVYVSGTSPAFRRHFEEYAQTVARRVGLPAGALVVDVGSNDGTLLDAFRRLGMEVLGVDPARAIARAASERGIPTVAEFLTPALARRLVAERGQAALVTANNVFAHADDLGSLFDAVLALLAPGGTFVFEVSYLLDVLNGTLFDTIYHEHLDYHSVAPLVGFFARHGAELIGVERVATHGGSLRGYVRAAGTGAARDDSVAKALDEERRAGLQRAETFLAWSERIDYIGARLSEILRALRAQGKRIAGFGAPAKATTLMHQFGLGCETLAFIVDDNPLKQGLYTPGLHVPVLPASTLREHPVDCLLLLAWNFADPIIARHREFLEAGGCFVVPLPEPKVITRDDIAS